MFIPRDNKLIKRLHEINQDAKSIFGDRFILLPSGDIFMDDKSDNNNLKGVHYARCETRGINLGSVSICFESRNYYRIMKNVKKANISGFKINVFGDIDIVFEGLSDEELIAKEKGVYVKIEPRICTVVDYEPKVSVNYDKSGYIELDPDSVFNMTKNTLYELEQNGLRCRVAKALIPGLKKSHRVYYKLEEVSNDLGLSTFIVERGGITSMHQYRFFIFN